MWTNFVHQWTRDLYSFRCLRLCVQYGRYEVYNIDYRQYSPNINKVRKLWIVQKRNRDIYINFHILHRRSKGRWYKITRGLHSPTYPSVRQRIRREYYGLIDFLFSPLKSESKKKLMEKNMVMKNMNTVQNVFSKVMKKERPKPSLIVFYFYFVII